MIRKKAIAALNKAKAQSKIAKVFSKKAKEESKLPQPDLEKIEKNIIREAKSINISEAVSKKFAGTVARKVFSWISERGGVTKDDINRQIAKEVKKYSKDLSFVYENRGKII